MSEGRNDDAPGAGGEEVAPSETPRETPPAAPGTVEWQPVVDGDKIEWRPVIVADGGDVTEFAPPPAVEPPAVSSPVEGDVAAWPSQDEESWPVEGEAQDVEAGEWPQDDDAYAAEPEFDYPDDVEPEGEADWDPDAAAVTPVTGNGAARARPPIGPGSRPSPRRPASGKGPARRPAPTKRQSDDRSPPAAQPNVKRQVIILSALTALVVGILVTALLISRDASDKGEEAQNQDPGTDATTVATLPESAFQQFKDEQTGFSLKYPKTWERLVPPVADIRLVVNAGGNDAFQVRVAPVDTPATTENIGNFKAVTDAVVLGDLSAKLLQEQLVTVNGLLTYYYLYSFQDPLTNTQGVHAHYFIFEGNRMFMLNFQTVPIEEFQKQAGIYDQIAESFVVEPRPNTTTPATTTTVP